MTNPHHAPVSRREDSPLDQLIRALAGLPGLGPRSARRVALYLLARKETTMLPLIDALQRAEAQIQPCTQCGNLDIMDPCRVCQSPDRDAGQICVVAQVSDLWAIERTGVYRGRYHVLGGLLSALDGVRPEDLNIKPLLARVQDGSVRELIMALAATVDGQSTAHYIADRMKDTGVSVSRLAHGIPVGGDLDYLDDGTIATALKSRR
jgi:recombination protein RecR